MTRMCHVEFAQMAHGMSPGHPAPCPRELLCKSHMRLRRIALMQQTLKYIDCPRFFYTKIRIIYMKEAEALRAKTDPEYRNRFLQDNRSFILKSAYFALNRYISESDDEWSVALLAFNEAIDDYEESRGSFDGFARLVIKRNLIDDYHKQEKYRKERTVDPSVMEGNLDAKEEADAFSLAVQSSVARLSEDDLTERLGDEIDALEQVLLRYNIDFFDLTSCAPKAGKTKESCFILISRLKEQQELMERLRRTGMLPVHDLIRGTHIHKKILERHRKYIITAAEIVCGDYPLLREYIPI